MKVVIKDNKNFAPLLSRIKSLLCKKSLYESKPQNEKNQTRLGNVTFWFQVERGTENKEGMSGNTFLIFDKDTSTWNQDEIIEDIESWEYTMTKDIIY